MESTNRWKLVSCDLMDLHLGNETTCNSSELCFPIKSYFQYSCLMVEEGPINTRAKMMCRGITTGKVQVKINYELMYRPFLKVVSCVLTGRIKSENYFQYKTCLGFF